MVHDVACRYAIVERYKQCPSVAQTIRDPCDPIYNTRWQRPPFGQDYANYLICLFY